MRKGSARGGPPSSDSVGTLLASIANSISVALRILGLSDKRHWGQDELEQVYALEAALDQARKDFQELSPLVGGQLHYEADRTHDSLVELRDLRDRHAEHVECLRSWSRSGGPIDPTWVRTTQTLQRELHCAQCRAARRVFASVQESSNRCLGAFLVHRKQREWSTTQPAGIEEAAYQSRYLEELRMCGRVGSFQRFGDSDIAFVCDFCDGHLVWEDLERMPPARTTHDDPATWPTTAPALPGGRQRPQWQATGFSQSAHESKQVVFAPVAIANHGAPQPGDWHARLLCPYCEEEAAQPLDEDDEEGIWHPDRSFDDVAALQEHFEWQHPAAGKGSSSSGNSGCRIM